MDQDDLLTRILALEDQSAQQESEIAACQNDHREDDHRIRHALNRVDALVERISRLEQYVASAQSLDVARSEVQARMQADVQFLKQSQECLVHDKNRIQDTIFKIQEKHENDTADLAVRQETFRKGLAELRRDHERDTRALRKEVEESVTRLTTEVEYDRQRVDELREVQFETNESCDGGIIDFLTVKCGGNVHERGIVEITSSGMYGGEGPENAADLHTDTTFWSPNRPNQWICYDFKRMVVTPTHYAIRSASDGSGCLMDWVVEGSMDGVDWIQIDRRWDCPELNGQDARGTFSVNNVQKVRRVRLTQMGLSHSGQNYFTVASFEIYGSLIH